MTTTVEAVHSHMAIDPLLADSLARGFISLRRTARKLIDLYDWDTSEEAVVSALRRYREANQRSPMHEAQRRLTEMKVDVRGSLALVSLPRILEVQERLLEAWNHAGPDQVLGVFPARRGTQVLLEADHLSAFTGHLDPRWIERIESPVSAIRLTLPGAQALNILMIALTALGHHQIDVIDLSTSPPEYSILVEADNAPDAYRVMMQLTDGPAAPGG